MNGRSPDPRDGLSLGQVLSDLRRELSQAIAASEGEGLRFKIDSVEVELAVSVARSTTGSTGVSVWVVEAGGEHAHSRESAHRMTLQLTPVQASADGSSTDTYVGDWADAGE